MSMTPSASSQTSKSEYQSSLSNVAAIPQSSQQTKRLATYIKVIDLAQSYKIDPEKIKGEIEKIKATKQETVSDKASFEENKDDSNSTISKVTDDSEFSAGDKKHQDTSSGTSCSKGYHKRFFSPINGGFNMCLRVGKVEVVVDKFRVDKSRVRLAEVLVGDETGSISLRARDDQIDQIEKVSKKGGALVLRNSSIELFQGKHLRLAVSKWGKISPYPDNIASTPKPPDTINSDLNLSIIDLNLVHPDVWLKPAADSPTSFKSTDSLPRQKTSTKQHHPSSQESQSHQTQYRKKGGRSYHERKFQPHTPYHDYGKSQHSNMLPNQNYNTMHGMTPNMMTNNMSVYSSMYSGNQYYPNYGNAMIQGAPQSHQLDQQKNQSTHEQFLMQQQQLYQMQQQMKQMEQILYSRGTQIDPNIASSFTEGPSHVMYPSMDMVESQSQMLGHQHHMGSGAQQSAMQKRHDPQHPDSAMNIEVPLSPQMNPNAVSFSPHYNIPDLNTGINQGQQHFLISGTQENNYYASYNTQQNYSNMSHAQRQDRDNAKQNK